MDRPSAEAERRRRLLEIALFLAGFLAAWTTRATALYPLDEAIASDEWRAAYSNLLKVTIWVLPAVAFARWVRRASPATYLGLAVFPAHRQWLLCLAATAIYLSGVSAFETMLDESPCCRSRRWRSSARSRSPCRPCWRRSCFAV